jgi:beta-phosphoglucomutase-like phosphatase (HAD superfamily)
MPVQAVLFDFNGTLSDDEWIQCAIFRELFAEAGKPLSEEEYYERLAGLSDPEIVEMWLGEPHPELAAERVRRFQARAADGSTVREEVREAVRYAAGRCRLAVVSGAARSEVKAVLAAAGLADLFAAIVSSEAVTNGKPDPAGYRRALELLDVPATDAIALEDTDVGVAAAQAAGVRCIALEGTLPAARLAAADEIAPALDVPLMQRLLAG